MLPWLEERGIRVVALSRDTVVEVAAHRERDGLTFTLLSDPDLAMIRKMGLEHQKAVEFAMLDLFGLPIGLPRRAQSMAIPTTLLVDEAGVVRWIDQADDYRIRGDEQRIRQAVQQAWG